VRQGDVVFTITARGQLQGADSEMLTAPMTGSGELVITELLSPGEVVKQGDIVVQFDTTEEGFKLREAEADLAEAEQHLAQAQAESFAKEEEARYSLLQAETELRLAELEARRNDTLAAIVARQNTLAVEAARGRLHQLQEDLASRKATTEAGVAIQEAAVKKARVKAETAQRNIDSMTLRAGRDGYVSVQQNTNTGFFSWGMQLPIFQVGDTVRPGMAVAQIPDLGNLEASARIAELDRGHLAVGQEASIVVAAVPEKTLTGRIKLIGSTTGPPWDRQFDCRITMEDPSSELRPGMSATIVITTDQLQDVTWLPSQAVFESDGRRFVYLRQAKGFVPTDISLVRRSESQIVLTGLDAGQSVALADPAQQTKQGGPSGPMQALPNL
jgi:multidrug efflux pump subunit AcrA (membrane-fusion protein)